jgi:sugar O-acyltransferase (sialic acid O-acetyltransferase NeuD family)
MTFKKVNSKIGIFGASGFSRELADICFCLDYNQIVFIDFDPAEKTYFDFPLLSEKEIPFLVKKGFCFAMGLGDNRLRKKVVENNGDLLFPSIIHPASSMGFKQREALKDKKGNIIAAGVRFTNNIQMGNFGIFNLNCTIGHDCIIKDYVNIAPGANISGNVYLNEGVYIGTNASILQGKRIDNKLVVGEYATIGAGAAVLKDVKPFDTVAGVPARSIKMNSGKK